MGVDGQAVKRRCARFCELTGGWRVRQVEHMKHVIALLALTFPAFADCPAVPDHSARYYELLSDMRAATSENEARRLMNHAWEIWTDAPDDIAQDLLDSAMRRIREADYGGALAPLADLIAYCPDYAEGFNQRAFVHFLLTDYELALVDLETTLRLFPDHLAAQSGMVLTLISLGRNDEAQRVLREAMTLNPWLPERRLLEEPDGEPL